MIDFSKKNRRLAFLQSRFLMLLFCMSGVYAVSAQSKDDFEIQDYHVDITLGADGVLNVEEQIQVYFNEKRRGIFRTLPYVYEVEGGRHQIKINKLRSPSHKYKRSREKGNRILRMGDPDKYLKGAETFILTYEITDAFMDRGEEVELFWNLIGDAWQVPIKKVDFVIRLPEGTAVTEENLRIFTGPYGSRYSEVEYKREGNVLSGFSTTPIYPGSAMSVALMIPKAVFESADIPLVESYAGGQSSPFASILPQDLKDIYYPAPMVLLTLFGWMFWTYGRDPKDPQVVLEHHPPEGMGPTEVGTFYDFKVNHRDLIALLPKWGHEGLIKISKQGQSVEGEMSFTKTAEMSAEAPMYEQQLFSGLFADRHQVFLSELKNKFYRVFSKSLSMARKETLRSELFDEASRKRYHGSWIIAVIILSIMVGAFVIVGLQMFVTGISFIVLGILALVIKSQRPRLSPRGLALNRKLIGFRQFLSQPDPAELNRLIQDDPEYLDKVFPYVVAFGLDKEWAGALREVSSASAAPYWYESHTSRPATYGDFTKSFQVREISSAFRSRPASEGGRSGGFSGSSGGSGGGFGGGGGGSW